VSAISAILMIAAAILAIGCFDKESKPKVVTPDPFPGFLPDTSADNVLSNLKKSWTDLNYNAYVSLLSDEFTYIFAPQDIGGPHNNPESWGKADELLSAHHLFSKTDANKEGYIVQSVTLSFSRGPDVPNDMETWTKVVISQIFLTVTTRQKDTGDPLDYLVQGDQANLWLVDEGGAWKIIRWEDKPIGGLAAGPAIGLAADLATKTTTWGHIKGAFR
jgi:hypothetical protein